MADGFGHPGACVEFNCGVEVILATEWMNVYIGCGTLAYWWICFFDLETNNFDWFACDAMQCAWTR
jgi:hypothetical protein